MEGKSGLGGVSTAGAVLIAVLAFALGMMVGVMKTQQRLPPSGIPNSMARWLSHPIAPPLRHVTTTLTPAQFMVAAGGIERWGITVLPQMQNFEIKGTYNVTGGQGNDIICGLMTQEEFSNWVNGHAAQGFYFSPGQVTEGQVDVRLAPGSYVLAFSNRFSTFSQKLVTQDIAESYEEPSQ